MKCAECEEFMNYPEDEMIFDDERTYQEAMDTGYVKAICVECYYHPTLKGTDSQ